MNDLQISSFCRVGQGLNYFQCMADLVIAFEISKFSSFLGCLIFISVWKVAIHATYRFYYAF